ncbi:hypothetical protein L6452_20593 [Arctium lappa]|uniref:Uncharacterized protein n=1 Tax=Arctium lappa TaxID=4217 RepID=A0ACB9BBS6_ARCLA|nr:hypothetical protein L6452_20593 [Arctium lappa]
MEPCVPNRTQISPSTSTTTPTTSIEKKEKRKGGSPGQGNPAEAGTKGQFHRRNRYRHGGAIGDRLLLVNQMSELQKEPSPPPAGTLPPPPPASSESPTTSPSNKPPPNRFDPSRMIGIIKRKALIKDLAAVYHAECLAYCQELLELQRKCEEPYADIKVAADSRKETMRPPKRLKKTH